MMLCGSIVWHGEKSGNPAGSLGLVKSRHKSVTPFEASNSNQEGKVDKRTKTRKPLLM